MYCSAICSWNYWPIVPTQNKGWRYITVLLLITSLHGIPLQILRHIDESLEFDLRCLFEMQIVRPHCIYLRTMLAHTNTSERKIKVCIPFLYRVFVIFKDIFRTHKNVAWTIGVSVHNTKHPVKHHPKKTNINSIYTISF